MTEELTAGAPAPCLAPAEAATEPAVVGGWVKRSLDVAGVVVVGLLALPLVLVVAAVVVLSSPGSVLFRQERVGAGGRRFTVLKFRTMREDAEEVLRRDPALYDRYLRNNHKLPLEDDPRVTPVGRFLRKSSLDELPQLWNILRGDMSLVGPRPVLPAELVRYGDGVDAYLSARPGLTGSWQVSGRSCLGYVERVALDTHYVRSWSLATDLAILARTPLAVLSCRGSV